MSGSRRHISYAAGFARNAGMSANPGLRKGLKGAWVSPLGSTGLSLPNLALKEPAGSFVEMTSANWTPTEKGMALQFVDGVSDYVDLGAPVVSGPPITMFSLAKVSETTSKTLFCIGFALSSEIATIRSIYLTSDVRYVYAIRKNSGTQIVVTDPKPAPGTWHTIAGTSSADDNHFLYADGVEIGSLTSGSNPTITDVASIGAIRDSSPNYGDGLVAVSYVWNRVLSPSEIKQLDVDPLAPFRLKRRPAWRVPAGEFQPAGDGSLTMAFWS